MNLRDTYNRIAKDWVKDHKEDDWWREGVDTFISFLKPGSLVLDVGCAGGTKSNYFIKRGVRVFGIDIADKFIEIARREVPEATFEVAGLEDIEKLSETFDGMFMHAVLLHIPRKEVEGILRRALGKLRRGGYLYIALKEKMPDMPDEEVKIENDYGYDYERFFSYFTASEIKTIMRNVGLKLVYEKIVPIGQAHRIQVIGKKL